MNCPFRRTERAIPLQVCSPLISQDIRLSELAPFQLSSNDDYSLAGCRGIAGPFPPPLWIRAPCGAIELCRHNIIGRKESQTADFKEPAIRRLRKKRWKANFF